MLRGLVALLRIAREIRRIRQILELAFSKEIQVHESYKNYKDSPKNKSDIVIDTSPIPKRDFYGKIIEEDEEAEDYQW